MENIICLVQRYSIGPAATATETHYLYIPNVQGVSEKGDEINCQSQFREIRRRPSPHLLEPAVCWRAIIKGNVRQWVYVALSLTQREKLLYFVVGEGYIHCSGNTKLGLFNEKKIYYNIIRVIRHNTTPTGKMSKCLLLPHTTKRTFIIFLTFQNVIIIFSTR